MLQFELNLSPTSVDHVAKFYQQSESCAISCQFTLDLIFVNCLKLKIRLFFSVSLSNHGPAHLRGRLLCNFRLPYFFIIHIFSLEFLENWKKNLKRTPITKFFATKLHVKYSQQFAISNFKIRKYFREIHTFRPVDQFGLNIFLQVKSHFKASKTGWKSWENSRI